MKLLLAVKSCAADISAGHNELIRQTWGKHVGGVTLRFFVGQGTIPVLSDEVRLNVPDAYYSLPKKTCAILHWALMQDIYDFVFLCDTDTFVRPELLYRSGFQNHDLMGFFAQYNPGGKVPGENLYAWPSGGAGYWLSRKAGLMVAANQEPIHWAEDCTVGQILCPRIATGEITAASHPGYGLTEAGLAKCKVPVITAHFCARTLSRDYDPEWMRRMYRRFYGR